jgi:hypothetical protein
MNYYFPTKKAKEPTIFFPLLNKHLSTYYIPGNSCVLRMVLSQDRPNRAYCVIER